MDENACITFLQWALPRLHMQWPGFRKVRGQVCKRIKRRILELGLPDLPSYRQYLRHNQNEWLLVDSFCRITISRFYRDKKLYACLGAEVLPTLLSLVNKEAGFSIWSVGAASGEEPYSLAMLWHFQLKKKYPFLTCTILASEISPHLLERAQSACYEESSIKDLPEAWIGKAFTREAGLYCLKPFLRGNVRFMCHDIRGPAPDGPFQAIFCRNLVFTYFDQKLQSEILGKLYRVLDRGGILVLGSHESLPSCAESNYLAPWHRGIPVYRKQEDTTTP